jgi:membrane fusion protein (multidrug efflux system)
MVKRTLAAALLVLSVAACDDGQQAGTGAAPAPSVVVTAVVRKDVTPSRSFVGRVEAIESVELRARVDGFLEQRAFTEGRDVVAGDLLFVIEQAPYQAEVERRMADLVSAEATLKNAKLSADRARKLVKRGNISQAKVDEAEAEETRGQAGVLQAKAALRQAELDLGYTTIKAPIDGRIGRAAYSVGNLVGSTSEPLATIVGLDPIYVQFAVSDRDLLDARREGLGERTALFTPHLVLGDGQRFEHDGRLAFIDNTVDQQTDTVLVRAEFPNSGRVLLPDQFVTVVIERTDPVVALVIPQAAIQEDQNGRFVLVLDGANKVQVRRVKMGAQEGADWIVEEGVEEGEQVVVEGLQKVRPGIAVNPVVEGAAPAPKPTEG